MTTISWGDAARVIAPLAPRLGGLIGGLIPFPGAALAGEVLGSIVAGKFGVPAEPEAVKNFVQSNPNEVVLAKLRAATEEMKARYAGDVEIEKARAEVEQAYYQSIGVLSEQVNQTMRAYVGHEHWFFSGWRAACGWVLVIYAFVYGGLLAIATAQAMRGNGQPLDTIKEAWPVYAAYFGVLAAVVGVYIVGRSRERAEAIRSGASTPDKKL